MQKALKISEGRISREHIVTSYTESYRSHHRPGNGNCGTFQGLINRIFSKAVWYSAFNFLNLISNLNIVRIFFCLKMCFFYNQQLRYSSQSDQCFGLPLTPDLHNNFFKVRLCFQMDAYWHCLTTYSLRILICCGCMYVCMPVYLDLFRIFFCKCVYCSVNICGKLSHCLDVDAIKMFER